MHKADYNTRSFAESLREVGLKEGDIVFCHCNVGLFGMPEGGLSHENVFQTILSALQQVVGPQGTVAVPTFTYSFCKGEIYDPVESASTTGIFTEFFRRLPQAQRSLDPIFSVAAAGKMAKELTFGVSRECFGQDSFWDRFYQAGGVICNFNFVAGSTFIHYVEKSLGLPYRYDKFFPGTIRIDGREKKTAAVFFCQDAANPLTRHDPDSFEKLALERGIVRTARAGRGKIVALTAGDFFELVRQKSRTEPYYFTTGGRQPGQIGLVAGNSLQPVALPPDAAMRDIIEKLHPLPRDLVSDGYDRALEALAGQIPLKVLRFPSGTGCWTWIVPEKWRCRKASLMTTAGEEIFSYADCPLHVASYSQPFSGKVTRQELFDHLYADDRDPGAVPFKFLYYRRDWGLCCSAEQKKRLRDSYYLVEIDSEFSYGELMVGECVIKGRKPDSLVLCAHLCHPAQANDDLSGIAVGVEVMRRLLQGPETNYTYRFIIVPETIGSLAYLSHNRQAVSRMRGGIFLEMLGLERPFTIQRSWHGGSPLDRAAEKALSQSGFEGRMYGYGEVVGNDERQFNAPGVRVPMISLSRITPMAETLPRLDYYPEYHTDRDTPSIISDKALEQSVDLVLETIGIMEKNRLPGNMFSGEVFLTRYGIEFDIYQDPSTARLLLKTINELDGGSSLLEISEKLGCDFRTVEKIVSELEKHGLVVSKPLVE
ncbi:MAG: DUF4910 domain-containing protein [Candidatus Glassbacteria bacterium]|nr:DUF4910 domain-containing protein [Candidatus Glassbacteria bacterium]